MNIIELIKRKCHYFKLYYDIRHEIGMRKNVDVVDVVQKNMVEDRWIRMDIIVRYLAIEAYYGKNDYGWELYEKMQDRRVAEGYSKEAVQKFRALIESIEKRRYDVSSYITVDREFNLIDGSHRLALSLYYGIKEIPALVIDIKEVTGYSIDWFVENGFDEDEIAKICKKKNEVAEAYGLMGK